MGRSKKGIERQHFFSARRLNFRAEEKRLREMGAKDEDFYDVLRSLLRELGVRMLQNPKFLAKNVEAFLKYRFFAGNSTLAQVAGQLNLSGTRISQIAHKFDRRMKHYSKRSEFKYELYQRVLERIMARQK